MRRTQIGATLLLVLVVTGAGCIGNPNVSTTDNSPTEISTTQTPSTTTTSAAATTTTTTVSTTPPPDNPWRSKTLVVGIEKNATDTRNYKPLVKEAIEYWNNNTSTYTPYNVSFALTNNSYSNSEDIVVKFTEGEIPTTSLSIGDLLGSAPLIEPDDEVYSTDTIYIKAGYNNSSTINTLNHEFGHYLSLEHGEEPMPLMAEYGAASKLPMPNATERPIAWRSTNLTVYTSVDNMDTADVNSQIQHALKYYESGADGWLKSSVTFTIVQNRTDADIIIEIYNSDVNTDDLEDDGSIAWVYGNDPDGDDALEYYSSSQIVVAGIEEDAVGWHVGSWMAYSLGGENMDDVPEPFENADYDDRRDEWWE